MVDRFVLRRRDEWARLERLLVINDGSAMVIEELGWRYRQVSADLALARRDYPTEPVTRYLNGLADRAGRRLYVPRRDGWRAVLDFYTTTFPRLFRATFRYTLAAFLLTFAMFLTAYIAVLVRPSLVEAFVPGSSAIIDQVKRGQTWFDAINEAPSLAASQIMTNNIRVSLLCYAGGVLAGIPTVLMLALNGINLGALAAFTQVYGVSDQLWSFVAAHGFLELSVIFISGGAGLVVARGVLFPGLRTRRESIALAGRTAVLLAFGCVPLLVVAGLLEGFVSPSGLPRLVKFLVGLSSGILLYLYVFLAGREPREMRAGVNGTPPAAPNVPVVPVVPLRQGEGSR